MDSVRRNREAAEPVKAGARRNSSHQDRRQYQLVAAQLDRRGIGVMMFGIEVGSDMRDAANNLVGVGQGGLGLGNRDYYIKDDEQNKKVLAAYKKYITDILKLAGNDDATAQKKAEATLAIETRIAHASYDNVKLRNVDANYHKMTYAQLVSDFPGIDWGNIFLAEGFPAFSHVDVGQPEPIHEVEKILAETPLDDLKAYAESHALADASSQLDDNFRAAAFALNQVLSGVQQDRPRWKRATSLVSDALGKPSANSMLRSTTSSKQQMLALVHNLQKALAQRIDESTWMSEATKVQAKDKLNNFIIKIGYPDKWKDYSRLQIDEAVALRKHAPHIGVHGTGLHRPQGEQAGR